ncbi:hypothetical protein [Rheinheimera nanhaiensis]|uniref:Uncharacterized protein n=1 Tax=Rheinheimera nanhaiensis E407-8 TaxID=562729 RepID=I1E2D9_9GAMM|nr:hypothetical protein [Rheinheimera nanhaiensis]GAB60467.1 hypothetical protein RNAN_3492 [Rheinheimera nanhaiensis E407-8]
MTNLTYSQQQLLNTLQITPLALNDAFQQPVLLAETGDVIANTHQKPDLNLPLAQDIACALPEGVNWFIQSGAELSLEQQHLITADLTTLRQAEQKKALWALLSSLDED